MINEKRNVILLLLGIFIVILLLSFGFRKNEEVKSKIEVTKEEAKLKVKNNIASVSTIVVCKYRGVYDDRKKTMNDCSSYEDYYINDIIQDQMKIDEVYNIIDRSYFEGLVVDKNTIITTSLVFKYVLLFYNKNDEKIDQVEVYIPLNIKRRVLLYFDTIKDDLIVDEDDIKPLLLMLDKDNEYEFN